MVGVINRHNGAYYGYYAQRERALKLTQTLCASNTISNEQEVFKQ